MANQIVQYPTESMQFSIVVPVYNRPEEVDELLQSLTRQTYTAPFEIVIVEDGSTRHCRDVVEQYRAQLPQLSYHQIPNSGPSRARNYGVGQAEGEYILILDSDVVLPEGYLSAVAEGLLRTGADAFGGPDAASPDFSKEQRAINYAMTSFLTTGGIRGGSASAMEQFKPRSFNLGVRRTLFTALGGFAEDMRYGEDIDFSLRLLERGAKVVLLPEAFVYHKRRIDLRKFYRQVFHSGRARHDIESRHPGTTKLVHYLPSAFVVGVVLTGILSPFLLLWALLILLDAYRLNRDWEIALRAVPASVVQLGGYGLGFITGFWRKGA